MVQSYSVYSKQEGYKKPKKAVTFNKDGTVLVRQGNVEKNLTREQYKESQKISESNASGETRAASANADVQALNVSEQELRTTNDIKDKINRGQSLTMEEQAFVNSKTGKMQQGQEQQLENNNIQNTETNNEIPTVDELQNSDLNAKTDFQLLQETFNFSPQQLKREIALKQNDPVAYEEQLAARKKAAIDAPLTIASEIIDGLTSVLQAKKGSSIQRAEGSLTDAITAINADIKRVKEGQMTPSEARISFELAVAALNRLESTNKGLSKFNLGYYTGGGDYVAAQVILKKQELEQLRLDLYQAIQEGQLMQQQQQQQQNLQNFYNAQ